MPGAILTSFPMRQQGKVGRRGSNQVKEVGLSVDEWVDRLLGQSLRRARDRGRAHRSVRHQAPRASPIRAASRTRSSARPATRAAATVSGGVPAEHGIKGAYAPVISVIDPDEMVMYLETGMGAKKVDE